MGMPLHQWTHEARDSRLGATLTTNLWWMNRGSWQRSGYTLVSQATLRGVVYTYREECPIDPTPKRRQSHRANAAADILRRARKAGDVRSA